MVISTIKGSLGRKSITKIQIFFFFLPLESKTSWSKSWAPGGGVFKNSSTLRVSLSQMFYGRSFQAFRGRLSGEQEQGGDKATFPPALLAICQLPALKTNRQVVTALLGPEDKASCRCAEHRSPRAAKTTVTLRRQGSACHRQAPLALLSNSHTLHSSPGTSVLRENGREDAVWKGWNTLAYSLPCLPGTQMHSFHPQLLFPLHPQLLCAPHCIPHSPHHSLTPRRCSPTKSTRLRSK